MGRSRVQYCRSKTTILSLHPVVSELRTARVLCRGSGISKYPLILFQGILVIEFDSIYPQISAGSPDGNRSNIILPK